MNPDSTSAPSSSSSSDPTEQALVRRQELLETASKHLFEGLSALVEATALAAPAMQGPSAERTGHPAPVQTTPPDPSQNGAHGSAFRPPSLNGSKGPSAAPITPPNPFLAAAANQNEEPQNPFSMAPPPERGQAPGETNR